MPRVFTWAGTAPSTRNLTVADLRAAKRAWQSDTGPNGEVRPDAFEKRRRFTQVTANTAEQAAAAGEAGIDLLIANSLNIEAVRTGNDSLFLTAAIGISQFATADEILREAVRVMAAGADAVMTQRSLRIIGMLATEGIPVMGHLGLVPRKSTWTGGLQAVGKTAESARELARQFRLLEDAGAFAVEAEVIPTRTLAWISQRSSLITCSLGSGTSGDVTYLFMEDICGESVNPPRHARAFGNLGLLQAKMHEERVAALRAFHAESLAGTFPSDRESASIPDDEFLRFEESEREIQPE